MRGPIAEALVGVMVVGVMVVGVTVVGVGAAGCTRTFQGSAVQVNPLITPNETLRASEKITIVRGDMELELPEAPTNIGDAGVVHNHHYPLLNQASFTIVSRDRLRFHVQIDHKWQEYADLGSWSVRLIDDQGHEYIPEAIEGARTRLLTRMWDREQRTAICSEAGRNGGGDCFNTVGYADDGWRRRQSLGSLSVFRGRGDVVFYQRDMFHAHLRWLKLIVSRSGEALEFTWNFQDDIATK